MLLLLKYRVLPLEQVITTNGSNNWLMDSNGFHAAALSLFVTCVWIVRYCKKLPVVRWSRLCLDHLLSGTPPTWKHPNLVSSSWCRVKHEAVTVLMPSQVCDQPHLGVCMTSHTSFAGNYIIGRKLEYISTASFVSECTSLKGTDRQPVLVAMKSHKNYLYVCFFFSFCQGKALLGGNGHYWPAASLTSGLAHIILCPLVWSLWS